MDWDDIKVLLALGRRGSARGAAQELGVSNSTVTRRLDELEHQLQTRLFDRTPDGYRMTAAAERLLPTAEHVEELLLAAERQITGGNQHLEGLIRLTTPDVSGMGFMMRRLARFAEEYPGIELQLMPSYDALDLSRSEADIAIRVMPAGVKPPDYLIGRYLSPITASTYVHRDLLRKDDPENVAHLNWIGKNPAGQKELWLEDTDFPDLPVRHSISNINLLVDALRARMGLGFMPCFAAFHHPDLVRVPGAAIVHHSDMWVLTHKDLRMSARLRVLREIIAEEFERIRHQLDTR
ncbi:LysR family transcriptional regulator [Parahaliea mediterranea]|uniref:LysR family transcriptional regulator n=1 Tax=Parahaliea mediterranea TaxID=651086 RepID=UPI000E2F7103|nr:LysR family transcriptional regulator [Parahaliea mediterranea]